MQHPTYTYNQLLIDFFIEKCWHLRGEGNIQKYEDEGSAGQAAWGGNPHGQQRGVEHET